MSDQIVVQAEEAIKASGALADMMDDSNELLKDAYQKVYRGYPRFADESALPWGEEPGPDHKVLVPRPDRPEEPFAWWDKEPRAGRPPYALVLRFNKSFVDECLAGKVPGIEDPRAWLMEKMTLTITASGMLR